MARKPRKTKSRWNDSFIRRRERNQKRLQDHLETQQIAETFLVNYYEKISHSRHLIHRLYFDRSTLMWDGDEVEGKRQIYRYLLGLPKCQYTVSCYEAEKLCLPTTKSVVIKVYGSVSYDDDKPFSFVHQLVIIDNGENQWLIENDTLKHSIEASKV